MQKVKIGKNAQILRWVAHVSSNPHRWVNDKSKGPSEELQHTA